MTPDQSDSACENIDAARGADAVADAFTEEAYLGDGVYASFDGYHIVLDLRAQGPDRIALEPCVLNALDRFRHRIASHFGVDRAAGYLPQGGAP